MNMMVPVGARLIDKEETVRSRPMKVLALGMSRTGTSSLRDALILLGYKPFHFRELMLDYRRYIPLWTEALEAKYYGKAVPYGRAEFDKILGDFDATEDNPSILFANELIQAYPEAKVILTNRKVDDWVKSMEKTVFKTKRSFIYKCLYRFHPLSRAWFPFATLLSRIWYDNEYDGAKAKMRFAEHYEHIREIVPKEKLLEMELGDGWEPLCKFLDVPVPDLPYPRSNDSEVFQGRHRLGKSLLVQFVMAIFFMILISIAVPMQARDLYARDPDLFLEYLQFLTTILVGVLICVTLVLKNTNIERLLYHGDKKNMCAVHHDAKAHQH